MQSTSGPLEDSTSPDGPAIPPFLLRRASSRLRAAAALVVASFAVSFPVLNWQPVATGEYMPLANIVASANALLSLAMIGLTRIERIPRARLLDIALVYEVLLGLGIALAETFATYDPYSVVRGVSWVCLWVTLFPLIVPTTRGKMLLAAVSTASMGIVALCIAIGMGLPAPTAQTFTYLVLPNFLAAGLAMVLYRIVHRLRVDVGKAQEMGAYKMVELLGRGGMGEVWRATHTTLARPAAIKLISPTALAARSPRQVATLQKRFKREARATAQLTSPHTISIYDFGVTDEGILYYVMELLHGTDLETMVDEHGPLPVARVVHLMLQACDSLAEAHDAGLIHRDIKPANLYVCRLGLHVDQVKVLDFGLVAQRGAGPMADGGTITGTPAYLAPEIIRGGDSDERVDVYALGCVAYWLLTGELVFERSSAFEVLYAHLEELPGAPSRRSTGVPAALDEIVLACLSKDADDRPRDARELATRLGALSVGTWSDSEAQTWWDEHVPEILTSGETAGGVNAEKVRTAFPVRE